MLMKMKSASVLTFLVIWWLFVSSTFAEKEIPKETELIPIHSNPITSGDLTINENGEELCEGDIVCDEEEKEGGSNRNAITDENFRWPKEGGLVIVPYTFAANATAEAKKQIVNAAADYAGWTCIKFVERTDQNDYINVVNRKGCWSTLGRKGGMQELSLEKGCDWKGMATHEMMHALGFEHEHNRRDRDEYITVLWDHVTPVRRFAFKICTRCTDLEGMPYDYRSITHYEPKAFSSDGEDVILTKNPEDRELIGKYIGLCHGDIKKLNQMYKCGGVTASPNKPNHGIVPCDGEQASNCLGLFKKCSDPERDYEMMKRCPVTCFGIKKGGPYDRWVPYCEQQANKFPNGRDLCVTWDVVRVHCTLSCSERNTTTGN